MRNADLVVVCLVLCGVQNLFKTGGFDIVHKECVPLPSGPPQRSPSGPPQRSIPRVWRQVEPCVCVEGVGVVHVLMSL